MAAIVADAVVNRADSSSARLKEKFPFLVSSDVS